MRRGDFSVEILPVNADDIRELDSGHVLARPGAVYAVRLRNWGPLRAVCALDIDGKTVTAGGLVLNSYSATTLERPMDDGETGRFTVVAEGDERVFGPDGGRDNPDLGAIEASFQRELPRTGRARADAPLISTVDIPPSVAGRQFPASPSPMPPDFLVSEGPPHAELSAIASYFAPHAPSAGRTPSELIERAAGTGLTGHSDQRFVPIALGPLEDEATVIALRLVIGTDEALSASRPLGAEGGAETPARPAARP